MAPSPKVSDNDPRSLNELAIDIATDIHKLATGLAHAGAPPKITAQVEAPAQLFAQVAKGLAAGPVGAAPATPGAPPPPGALPPGAPPAAAEPPPGAPSPPGAPPPGPGTPQTVAPARGGIHNTLAQAHADHLKAMTQAQSR